ncbi:S-layer homology domain-containing protein [Paenibacillus sp.]|uniref:S-layer homology domain-containing protein n=1 Tax=Paenibacillus sp. TaxID=58172 RepID=UPI002D735495|nr:S-layer homology domain-containing protein [Paenibacillus sp.]HZG86153.1 S-layer homology domain-containing protein [Paenibacillus sp.]
MQIIDSIWGNSSDMPPELAHTMYDFIVATAQVIHGEDMDFINYAGTNFVLQADGKPEVYAQITGGFSTNTISGFGFEIANIDSMEVGTAYRLIAPSASTVYRWEVASDVTLIRVSGSKPPVTSGAVPWIESGVTHVPEGPKSFKTYVDRSKLPESMKRFTRIRVMSSDRDLNIRSSGTIHQFTNFSEVYNDQTGYGSSIPRSGQTYALTILYDNEFKPLGFREDVFQVGENGGTVPQQPPANPQPPRNPLDYGSDIDPNLLNKPAQQLFSDVDASYWALSSINDLSSRGVLGGYPDGKFRPERTVTRAELAKIMVLAAGLTVEPVTQTSFADVKPGDWHAPFVEAAKFYLNGYALPDGRLIYDPDAPALREDLAVAIVKLKGYDATHFPDHSILDAMFTDVSSISSYARNYVSIAVESKLVSGFPDDTFRAQLPVTRAQAAAMLHRAYQFGSDTKTEQQANRVKVEFPLPAGVPGTLPTQPPIAIPVPVPPPTTVTETVYGQL